jgi:hypothetical protein
MIRANRHGTAFSPKLQRIGIQYEAGLDSPTKPFELTDVFRYSPQILAFLDRLNQRFPATDLAEDWALTFGASQVADGETPVAKECQNQLAMAQVVAERARVLTGQAAARNEHVAVLCLDHDRFAQYREASIFDDGFISVSGRDELGAIERFHRRAVLSMP